MRRAATRAMRHPLAAPLEQWRDGAARCATPRPALLAMASPRKGLLGRALRQWSGARCRTQRLQLVQRAVMALRRQGLAQSLRAWVEMREFRVRHLQQASRVFHSAAVRALCSWSEQARQWQLVRRACARMLAAEAVRALVRWAAVATLLRGMRALLQRGLNASCTWALVEWRAAALARAVATARLTRATQLERTLAFVAWRSHAGAMGEARRLLGWACSRLCSLQLARGLTSLRKACDARRALRAWLLGLWRGATRKRAIQTWTGAAATRGRRLQEMRRCVALLRGSVLACALAAWRAGTVEHRARTAAARRAAVRLLARDTARALGTWAEAAAARRWLQHLSPGWAAAWRAWRTWLEAAALAVAVQYFSSRAAMRMLYGAAARALARWMEMREEAAAARAARASGRAGGCADVGA